MALSKIIWSFSKKGLKERRFEGHSICIKTLSNHHIEMYRYLMFLFLLMHTICLAQKDTIPSAKHQLVLEGGGFGGFGSVNYHHLLIHRDQWHSTLGIGISTIRLKNFKNEFQPDLVFPLTFTTWYGAGKHHPEIAIAQIFTSITAFDTNALDVKRKGNLSGGVAFGYRYQKNKGGLILKVNYYLIWENYRSLLSWPGASVGYAF